MRLGGVIAALLVVCTAATAELAHAQDAVPSAAERAAAREAYTAGVAAANASDWPVAHEQFARSYGLFPHPRTLLNLAGAQAQTGRLVEAMESYRTYVREAEAAGEDAASRTAAQAELAELDPRIPRATFAVDGLLEADELRLDDTTVSHAVVGTALPVNPGDHRLSVARLTREVIGRDFSAAEGERLELSLVVPAPPPPPPEDDVSTGEDGGMQLVVGDDQRPMYQDDSPFTKWWFWAITGGVLIAAIVTTGVVVANAQDDPFQGNAGQGIVTVEAE